MQHLARFCKNKQINDHLCKIRPKKANYKNLCKNMLIYAKVDNNQINNAKLCKQMLIHAKLGKNQLIMAHWC